MPITTFPESNVTISIPLPQADFSPQNIAATCGDFHTAGLTVGLRAEGVYPCAASWVEIALSLFAGAAFSHYAEKIFDGLDRLLIKAVDSITLTITIRERSKQIGLERRDREGSIKRVAEALKQLEDEPKTTILKSLE
jgi:hypothetical protein